MQVDQSLWQFFVDAGPVVKTVMIFLLLVSIASWTFIIERIMFFTKVRKATDEFEDAFWSGSELSKLYSRFNNREDGNVGMTEIFRSGFSEYMRMRKKHPKADMETVMESVQRAMRIADSREVEKLESHLSFLATVGSTSPYIGLFGTVWGIMTAFRALGAVQQATIAMVAPGIAEALIATAMGLFAAIPAVIAYNRFANTSERLSNQFATFEDEFSSILYRQGHVTPNISGEAVDGTPQTTA